MAKKADLLAEAAKLGVKVTEKNTIAEIEAAIASVAEKAAPTAEEALVDAEAELEVAEKTETFEIDRNLFYSKTFKLLKSIRSALMYLSFLVYIKKSP